MNQRLREFSTAVAARATSVAAIASVAVGSLVTSEPAEASWGDSFLAIPGIDGDWSGAKYNGWVRVSSNYWKPMERAGVRLHSRKKCGNSALRNCMSGPFAPPQGASALMIAIDKRSPVLPQLMDKCRKSTPIAELTYAESSSRNRGPRELGPRPANIPEYFEYTLKDVRLSDCTVVEDAPEQAFVVNFNDIEWRNYTGTMEGDATSPTPAKLMPIPANITGATKAFVLTWFGLAHGEGEACPTMNAQPTEDDYYRLMPKEQADKIRAQMAAERTGVNFNGEQMARRGPNQLNVCLMPGIVADPGNHGPRTKIAAGLDLDGDDGSSRPPAGVCKHNNFASADGRGGIDNQLFAVQGCTPGYLGRKGFANDLLNASRRDGRESQRSMLLEISGIDSEQNDNEVYVTLVYSQDRMTKSVDGLMILSDYTYRVTDEPAYTHYFARMRGRIVNGIIITEPAEHINFVMDVFANWELWNVRMRMEIKPDGSLKGLIGGYQDWRQVMASDRSSLKEDLWDYQCPGMYNALKRAADGLKDPVTGECNGISTAFDIEGAPAFIADAQPKSIMTKAETTDPKATK